MKVTYYYLDGTVEDSIDSTSVSNLEKKLHRLDGPAVDRKFGNNYKFNSYYIYGKYIGYNLSDKEFETLKNKILKEYVFK